MLGEAQAQCKHLAGVPLMPEVADALHLLYLAKGVRATTAIEGNTLTEEEVQQRIEGELELPPSKEYLGTEVDNVVTAINLIGQTTLTSTSVDLSVVTINEYNKLVLQKLENLPEEVILGQFRDYRVTVGKYLGAPPDDLDYLMDELCKWLNTGFDAIDDIIIRGIIKAIIAHLYIAWIHPFGDGNGRTARLIEFQILLSSGVPTAAAHILSNHYNQTRTEYYRYLDESNKHKDGVFAFLRYALQGFIDGLREQIETIEASQLQVLWRNHIFDKFREVKDTKTNIRRRKLILDLSDEFKPRHTPELRYVSPRIAETYSGLDDKTIQRDVNILVKMDLVRKTVDGVIPNIESMRAFLPQRRIEI